MSTSARADSANAGHRAQRILKSGSASSRPAASGGMSPALQLQRAAGNAAVSSRVEARTSRSTVDRDLSMPAVSSRPLQAEPATAAPDRAAIEHKRTDALSLMNYYNERTQEQFADYKLRMLNMVSGFSDAAASVQETIAKQAAQDQLTTQLVFSALTIVLSGGAASLIATAGEFAAKDIVGALIGAGIGEGFSAVGPMVQPAPALPGVPSDPLSFRTEVETLIESRSRAVHGDSARAALAFHDVDDKQWEKWDYGKAKAAMDALLIRQMAPLERIPKDEPKEGWKRKFERNLWAQWLANLHVTRKANFAGEVSSDDEYQVSPRFGSEIETRLTNLNIAADAGVEFNWWVTSDKTRLKCMQWGKTNNQVLS